MQLTSFVTDLQNKFIISIVSNVTDNSINTVNICLSLYVGNNIVIIIFSIKLDILSMKQLFEFVFFCFLR